MFSLFLKALAIFISEHYQILGKTPGGMAHIIPLHKLHGLYLSDIVKICSSLTQINEFSNHAWFYDFYFPSSKDIIFHLSLKTEENNNNHHKTTTTTPQSLNYSNSSYKKQF